MVGDSWLPPSSASGMTCSFGEVCELCKILFYGGGVIPAKAGITYWSIDQQLIWENGNRGKRFLIWATQDFIPCYKCREVKRTCICYTGASFVGFRNDVSFWGYWSVIGNTYQQTIPTVLSEFTYHSSALTFNSQPLRISPSHSVLRIPPSALKKGNVSIPHDYENT